MEACLCHKMGTFKKSDSEEELMKKLKEICDCDFTGENGDDYVDKDFLNEGFHSNLEGYYNIYKDLPLEKRIYEILSRNYNSGSYKNCEIKTVKIKDTYIISVAALYFC